MPRIKAASWLICEEPFQSERGSSTGSHCTPEMLVPIQSSWWAWGGSSRLPSGRAEVRGGGLVVLRTLNERAVAFGWCTSPCSAITCTCS